MMKRKSSLLFIVVAALLAAGFLLAWSWRGTLANVARDTFREIKSPVPEAVSYQEFQATPPVSLSASTPEANQPVVSATPSPQPRLQPNAPPPSTEPAASVNLDVPFTSQAPFENWDLPYKEACEEASLLMVDRFYKGKRLAKQEVADVIERLVGFERARFGHYEDTTAEETASVAREYFGYQNVKVVPGPLTVDDIKKEIAQGRPVILPMAGRLLGNRYFRQPGPYYHMLVVKGYTPTEFITNDPGTKRGQNYRYPYATLLNAVHDFDPLNITSMPQAMIVVVPNE